MRRRRFPPQRCINQTRGTPGRWRNPMREFQKRKIGTRLFRAVSADLMRHGFNAAALWVLRDNLRARRFYGHYGGKVIAEREDVRDGAALVELSYGWPNLKKLDRLVAHKCRR